MLLLKVKIWINKWLEKIKEEIGFRDLDDSIDFDIENQYIEQ